MFEVKARGVETKESSTETDEGSSSKQCSSVSLGSGSGSGSGSLYLYDSQDWVVSPVVSPDEPGSTISPMLAEETFRYMTYLAAEPSCSRPGAHSLSKVLSGDRVEQMTKTYNDMDVVTHLLAERDRDLELAARIGQSLLHRNHVLQERNESVEEQLSQALDQVHQLQHELCKKDALLRMVASASEESDTESGCSTPSRPRPPQPPGAAALLALSQLDSLQGKLAELEEENVTLRSEARLLKRETVSYEEKEQRLVSDCVKELRESNTQMVSLTDELSQTNEELRRHQEEIAQLLSQIVQLQHRVKELALEKEELRIHLQASKNAQRQLTAELDELADRNAECVGMLQESQEEIRELRSKTTPPTGLRRHLPYGLLPMDSLAAEIEGTMRKELSVEEEMTFQDQRVSQKRVFQTVRSVNEAVERAATPPIPGSARCSSLVMTAQPFRSGQSQDGNREEARLGRPGAPGGNDLVAALHRLSLRRQNFLCERQFFQAERDRKLGPAAADCEGSGWSSPTGSAFSAFSSFSSLSEFSGCFKTFLPEKLQIVKPMEGSLTLHHWQQLAKPHLATILDPHPGVVTKGFRPLPQDAVYRLTDLEEDEEDERRGRRGGRRGGEEEEEEEEEGGGITFQVQCSSTPEEKRERKRPPSPDSAPAVPPSPPATTSDLGATSAAAPPSAQAAPVMTFRPVQSQNHISTITTTTTTTTTSSSSSAPNPGKCQSSTFSTYTFTTCRILHPSDLTQVTPSCQSSVSVHTPSSLRSGPSTPVTPCRLSLGDSSSFSPLPLPLPRRPAPAAPPPPGGLAKLLLEKGISAQTPPKPRPPRLLLPRLLPGTPPNSPSHSPPPSPAPSQPRPSVVVAPDNFLASRPAELFLQDVYGLNLGRAPRTDLPSPSPSSDSAPSPGHVPKPDPINVDLLGRLRRLGLAGALRGRRDLSLEGGAGASTKPRPPPVSATFVAAGGGSLLDGLRRNQSLPAMIGARGGGPVYSPSQPAPPAPPTSLALAPPPWGDLKEPQRRRPASLSHAPPTAPPKR